MKIRGLVIKNFQSIRELVMEDIDNTLILVGKNNTGKTVVLNAILAAAGVYKVKEQDFYEKDRNIEIGIILDISEEDMVLFHQKRIVSIYRNYSAWKKDFCAKLSSYQDGQLRFNCVINKNGKVRYKDGMKKDNHYIRQVFPKIHYIDHSRDVTEIQDDLFLMQNKEVLAGLREDRCIFDKGKKCSHCFQCIGMINKKMPEKLTVFETSKLLEFKLFHLNLGEFNENVNTYFHKNSGYAQDIKFVVNFKPDEIFQIDTIIENKERGKQGEINTLSEGTKSIYILSLLEAYIEEKASMPSILLMEDPEIYLHPQLQKVASEILYRLSKKNQVIFSTHSPNMIFNFSSRQIKQVILDSNYDTVIKNKTDIDEILDDLGYTANDFLNVSFVFIVEGKQDRSRLPLLLEKYYSEIYDEDGNLQRISIISTNSCTNIKTYANLKYMNKLYLKDQFLMIRDSDGKDPKLLERQLCGYYEDRAKEDFGHIPRVQPKNVLILKYYSFENYFLDAKVMADIGVLSSEEEFYQTLFQKYQEYLHKLTSVKKMLEETGVEIKSAKDIKAHIETIKVYVRGHNLYDIFYGRYKGKREKEILRKYIDKAPRETFDDILRGIDRFVYFESKKKRF